jgi:hypothetical protein
VSQQDTANESAARTSAAECATPEYSVGQTALENMPYAAMLLLGAAAIRIGLGASGWAWGAAGAYAVYGLLGSLWIILFVCPYCSSFGLRSCPCGYGVLAARLRERGDPSLFARKFRRHIPVIVPLWIIPLAVGIPAVIRGFSWALVTLLSAFCLDAFVILPLLSKAHGCSECPQKKQCPWMGVSGSARRAGRS